MTQRIKPTITSANFELLAQQLTTAVTTFTGLIADADGLGILLTDEATQADIATALSIATVHNPALDTPEQAATKAGKISVATLLAVADTALTQLEAKEATFHTTSTFVNAAPLLLEISQDLQAVIKAMKYIVKNQG